MKIREFKICAIHIFDLHRDKSKIKKVACIATFDNARNFDLQRIWKSIRWLQMRNVNVSSENVARATWHTCARGVTMWTGIKVILQNAQEKVVSTGLIAPADPGETYLDLTLVFEGSRKAPKRVKKRCFWQSAFFHVNCFFRVFSSSQGFKDGWKNVKKHVFESHLHVQALGYRANSLFSWKFRRKLPIYILIKNTPPTLLPENTHTPRIPSRIGTQYHIQCHDEVHRATRVTYMSELLAS